MSLIGVSGKIGSGKDTVGAIIQWLVYRDKVDRGEIKNETSIYHDWKAFTVTDYHVGWEIKKFADKLKDMVCLLLGCTRTQLEDREYKEGNLGADWAVGTIYTNQAMTRKILVNSLDEISAYRISNKPYYGHSFKFMTPRLILQLLGTEAGRDIIHPQIWVNAMFSGYVKSPDYQIGTTPENLKWVEGEFPNWIATDMRFPNELSGVKSRGGITLRVNREKRIDCNSCQGGGCPVCSGYGYYLATPSEEHASETSLDNATFDYVIDNNGTIEELIDKVRQILHIENIL